jgi:hypothetical protein
MMINAFMAPMPIVGGPNSLSQFQQPMAWPTGPGGAGPKGMHGYGVVPSRHDYRGYSGVFALSAVEWYGSAEVAFRKYDNLIREYRRAGRKVPKYFLRYRARAKAAFDTQKAENRRKEKAAKEAEKMAADALAAAGLTNPMVDTPIPGMPSGVPDPTILNPAIGLPAAGDEVVEEAPDYTKWIIAGGVALAAAAGLAYAMSRK